MTIGNNKETNLKKEDIAKNISKKVGISSLYSTTIINDIIKILQDNLKLRLKLKIKNFGVFVTQYKKKRLGRNPKNKQEHDISERIVVSFKTSDHLKRKINKSVKNK
jgi:integration host factor subunit alpha|tara:strand:+ start:307 stop:627 length:321 start_codon:yes stop_codon:yes gene_type:complete